MTPVRLLATVATLAGAWAAVVLGAAASEAASGPAAAAAAPPRRTITIGAQTGAIPFAYAVRPLGAGAGSASVHGEGSFAGYSIDLCREIVAEWRRRHPDAGGVEVRFRPVTSALRLMMLLTGEIDLECGSTSATDGRRALGIAFSPPIFVSDVALLVAPGQREHAASATRWALHMHESRDAPPTIVTTRGSTSVEHLRRFRALLGRGSASARLPTLQGASHDESFELLRRGKADAFMMDRALLAARLVVDPKLADRGFELTPWSIDPNRQECYGIAMRARDADLVEATGRAMRRLAASGELRRIYERWFVETPSGDRQWPPDGMKPDRAIGLPPSWELWRAWQQVANSLPADAGGACPLGRGARP